MGAALAMAAQVVLAALSCRSPMAPLPAAATRLEPPAVFARWWAMTETCSGLSGDLHAVEWYEVPGSALLLKGETVNGYWTAAGNRIILPHEHVLSGFLVRHEMLHALLHVGGHPRDQFLGKCAALVNCGPECAHDAGPFSHGANWAVVPPESVVVTASVDTIPRNADGQRWISLTVSVQNPSSRAVYVQSASDSPTPPAFAYDVRGPLGGVSRSEAAADSSRFVFGPYERKPFLFEFLASDSLTFYTLPPGEYVMRGGYALRWSQNVDVAVVK